MAYDLPETIADSDTVGLGEAQMSVTSDLDYHIFEPAVSTIKWCDAREDLGFISVTGRIHAG